MPGMPKAESKLTEYSIELFNKAISLSDENIDIVSKGEEFIEKAFR